MNEKYEYMFLMYMYDLLGLKAYEIKLEKSGIKQMEYAENGDLFKYFSLLNKGDVEFLSEEEKHELELLSFDNLGDFFTNDELRSRCESFLQKTYKKYFFSNLSGDDYVYYGPVDYNYMAPTDAIALGINYVKFSGNASGDMYEDTLFNQECAVYRIINDIQENKGPSVGLKVAVIEQNEITLSRHSVSF